MAETKTLDAIALLKQDHREVEDLFEQFEKARGEGRKQKLAQQICQELIIHTKIEEEIFYPACKGEVEEDDLKEAYVEHDGAKVLITDILNGDGESDEYFDSKVKVLQEEIEHHVKEEESGKDSIFGQVRGSKIDLDALGEQLAARKMELKAEFEANGIPKPELTTIKESV
ncbi:hemerythrin domain-containing protein [Sphingomonas piscis]|uniref:Hemerythrin domain-containing protein n=1 Tax=Sphingomonas piscis TaxID=2714943 RepID=A0A6G7YQQ2_9SPHN|nr:hemerythrin domain-containing protein [Sphingomonas piscis]QIK79078.1 hemerythrin domain-containing protein [Sphingomonas piscis]